MLSMPRCGCQGNHFVELSEQTSSRTRNGSSDSSLGYPMARFSSTLLPLTTDLLFQAFRVGFVSPIVMPPCLMDQRIGSPDFTPCRVMIGDASGSLREICRI